MNEVNNTKPVPEETHGEKNTMQLQPMATAPKDRWIMICTYTTVEGMKTPYMLVTSHWCVFDDKFLTADKDELHNQLGWMEVPAMPQENSNAQD